MKQQSKMEWLHYGDENTRLFFAKTKQRKLAPYIYPIKDGNDNTVEGFEVLGKTLYNYKEQLGTQYSTRESIDAEVALHQPFTDKDIKEAFFSIPSIKSPDLDGFSSGFYKVTWSVINPLRGRPRIKVSTAKKRTPGGSAETANPQKSDYETTKEPIEQEHPATEVTGAMDQRMEEQKIRTPRISSYVAMVDTDEGMQLNYVSAKIVDGIKYARIEKQDVALELEHWSTAVLCGVMGANPPLEVMEGYIRRIWRNLSITKVAMVRKGLFLVRFENE
ncbi:hypothetical protein Cgig2_033924 [Carnegiea gigantea]|uniref:Uncharacterized protein n=1 Tax=Carnegiea gigantea TaxID=171969 RepID=A0A9Q1JS43_9CARY|nr:hypothetical protein Cgig2_033924 [Carnegiea gigantea]